MGNVLLKGRNAANVVKEEEVKDLVMGTVLRSYYELKAKYEKGMEDEHPEAYECEEIPDKSGPNGKRTLQKDVDDEARVKESALTGATGKGSRQQIRNQVWAKIEPGVADQTKTVSSAFVRNRANKAARAATDKLVDVSLDQVRDSLAALLKEGKDLPPPPKPDPESPASADKDEEEPEAAPMEGEAEEPTEAMDDEEQETREAFSTEATARTDEEPKESAAAATVTMENGEEEPAEVPMDNDEEEAPTAAFTKSGDGEEVEEPKKAPPI